MDEQTQQRRKKKQDLVDLGINPYANDFQPSQTCLEIEQLHGAQSAQELEDVQASYRVAGRIMALRSFGKVTFLKLTDRTGSIQLFVQKNQLGEGIYSWFKKDIEVGDIIGIAGRPMRTKTGELTLFVTELRLLTKGLKPLPEKWSGLKDVEIRYRRRYLDLIVNPDVRQVFVLRAQIVQYLRWFLEQRGFLEVETPMMHALAGGAAARPFVTHHNSLDMELYMRVAPELFLKRLLVGGLERVYELNRCFRNEGVSTQHNPEFTMLEFYQAYASYEDLMRLSEELLSGLCEKLHGKTNAQFGDVVIDYSVPFRRMTLHQSVAEHLQINDVDRLDDKPTLISLCEKHNVNHDPKWDRGKLLMALFEELVEETLVQPTFITDFPLSVSPLSRKKESREDLVDRFELYIAGREIANAFSELNDPDDQRERFRAQMQAKVDGDEEAMPYDEDYVLALEYGMPPAAGQGIGIDRLVMLMADASSIRDVILFPLMRPER